MPLSVDQVQPWVTVNLESQNESTQGVKLELDYLASGPKLVGDTHITRWELWRRRFAPTARPLTAHMVSTYFKARLTEYRVQLLAASGEILEEIFVYDDNDGHIQPLPTPSRKFAPIRRDMIVKKTPGSETGYTDITETALKSAEAVLKFFYVYDPAQDRFRLRPDAVNIKEVFQKIRAGEIPRHSGRQKHAWEDLAVTKNLNIYLLVALYRLYQMARYSRDREGAGIELCTALSFRDLRNIMDWATPAVSREKPRQYVKNKRNHRIRNQQHYELENKFITDVLATLSRHGPAHPESSQRGREELAMIVIEMNHLIDMTDGEYGLEILKGLSDAQWESILNDVDLTQSILTTLAQATYVQSLDFYQKRYGKTANLAQRLMAEVLESEPPANRWLRIITACAVMLGQKTRLKNSESDRIFSALDEWHQAADGKPRPPAPLIRAILNTLGEISQVRQLPEEYRSRAFLWCQTFLKSFESFGDAHNDRTVILQAQDVLLALDSERARSFFFEALFDPLRTDFNPREARQLAYNAYYRKVGSAQRLAEATGESRLAFRRELDQSSNEWGRYLEKKIREDPIFRLDVLKEAKTALEGQGKTSVQKIVAAYDPDGVLQRNLSFIHVMRYVFLNRAVFDPLDRALYQGDSALARSFAEYQKQYLETLNFRRILNENLHPDVYHRDALLFDQWLLDVQDINPEFFDELKAKIAGLPPKDVRLSFQVFFLEVNETETFQYYIDPVLGPIRLFDFVGRIRSWTSGYHGRLLTRMQAFFLQDRIRRDVAQNPNTYKKPEAYFASFEHMVGRERFFDEEDGIIAILREGAAPTGAARLNFSEDEALMILKYFSQTGFAAYLPGWLLFIAEHRFTGSDGEETFVPLKRAFDVLATSRLPRDQVEAVFADRGYLTPPDSETVSPTEAKRQRALYTAARACLKRLPQSKPRRDRYQSETDFVIPRSIRVAGKRTKRLPPARFDELLKKFQGHQARPGSYFTYRRLAKRLLKTHQLKAIRAIVDEALTEKGVSFPKNAPLKPLFKGLLGYLLSNEQLEQAIQDIAVNSPARRKGLSAMANFAAILVRWAKKNRIDLNETFARAFESYEAPEEIRFLQEEIERLENEISKRQDIVLKARSEQKKLRERQHNESGELSGNYQTLEETATREERLLHGDDGKIGLITLKHRKEQERNRKIARLADDPTTFADQAIMQVITFVYNTVRRQFLQDALISGGEASAELIQWHLENEVFPERERLRANKAHYTEKDYEARLAHINERIAFLLAVLARMERTEYFNDFNIRHKKRDRYKRL